jgi:NADH-quinone oxidoreductase subunit J
VTLSDYVQWFSFFVLSFVAVSTGITVIIVKNPVHSALFFVLMLFHLAGIFILLGAEFIAMIQIMVYAGAILVLFLFVIMLLKLREGPSVSPFHPSQRFIAPVLGILLLMEVIYIIGANVQLGTPGTYTPEKIAALGGNVQAVGTVLYTTYLLPFEIASVILLLAAVGAVVLARKGYGDVQEPIVSGREDFKTTTPEFRPEEEPVGVAGGDSFELPKPRNRYLRDR